MFAALRIENEKAAKTRVVPLCYINRLALFFSLQKSEMEGFQGDRPSPIAGSWLSVYTCSTSCYSSMASKP